VGFDVRQHARTESISKRAPSVGRQFKYALFYRIETDGSVVIACLAHRQDLSLARRRTLRIEPT
jgi:hypothetical protein